MNVEASDLNSADDARRTIRLMNKQDDAKWGAAEREIYVYAHTADWLYDRIADALALHTGKHFCSVPGAPQLGQMYGEGDTCPTARALKLTPSAPPSEHRLRNYCICEDQPLHFCGAAAHR